MSITCDNCQHCKYGTLGFDEGSDVIARCVKGHWDILDPHEKAPESDPWVDCPDFVQGPFNVTKRTFSNKHITWPPDPAENNFAMIIPTEPYKPTEMKEDPNGAPIYAGCTAELCACTGACKRIVGYSQDPKDIEAHREYVRKYNERPNMADLYKKREWTGDTEEIQIYSNRKPK